MAMALPICHLPTPRLLNDSASHLPHSGRLCTVRWNPNLLSPERWNHPLVVLFLCSSSLWQEGALNGSHKSPEGELWQERCIWGCISFNHCICLRGLVGASFRSSSSCVTHILSGKGGSGTHSSLQGHNQGIQARARDPGANKLKAPWPVSQFPFLLLPSETLAKET